MKICVAGQGAFVMGITPAQSVAAAFSYARAQGVRRVAVVSAPGPLGEAGCFRRSGPDGPSIPRVCSRLSGWRGD